MTILINYMNREVLNDIISVHYCIVLIDISSCKQILEIVYNVNHILQHIISLLASNITPFLVKIIIKIGKYWRVLSKWTNINVINSNYIAKSRTENPHSLYQLWTYNSDLINVAVLKFTHRKFLFYYHLNLFFL